MALPAPRPLLVLLLLAASLLAEGSDLGSPSCTEDAMNVSRGHMPVMSCNMSTPLTHVAIRLSAPGEASRLIFAVDGPGNFSNKGWRLEVRGGEARLVIPDAQPAQAGEYTWFLVGTHGSVTHTTSLNVSEPPVTEAASTPPAGTPPPPPASTVSPVTVLLPAVIVSVLLLAVMAALVALTWSRGCRCGCSQHQAQGPRQGQNKAAWHLRCSTRSLARLETRAQVSCASPSPADTSPDPWTPAPKPGDQPFSPGPSAVTWLPKHQVVQADPGS